jgi:2-C-methyl-D-erythritol 2,4-cyclodiphosphate synthase
MRIGHGFDVHAFGPGDHVMIGGVHIPHGRGVIAHSDGDVALHALCDALLGAAGLGDIGGMFPDTDPRWAGADSRELLRQVAARLAGRELRVSNADVTVVAQAPRLAPHVGEMRARIAADLGIELDRVNIKATTTEKLGYIGREEGLAAHAVVLLDEPGPSA